MKIEWDLKKVKANLKKHDVSFEEAASALSDSMAVTAADPDHSLDEERYITFGVSGRGREIIRIISARAASKGEREFYEEG
jgi:uncharacterized DUF497 family protein